MRRRCQEALPLHLEKWKVLWKSNLLCEIKHMKDRKDKDLTPDVASVSRLLAEV